MNTTLPNLETRTHDQLTEWPGNARQGDVDTIKESMRTNGVFQPIIIQTSTGRIIAGNHRYKALVELHKEAPDTWGDNVTVLPLDVSDEEAMRIHLADNRTSDLAEWDNVNLYEQLSELVGTDNALVGSGFTDDDLDSLRMKLEDAEDEDWSDAADKVTEGDPTVASRSFFLPADDAGIVDSAIEKAKTYGDGSGNANGEALVVMAKEYLGEY